jgi:hypothetical protein
LVEKQPGWIVVSVETSDEKRDLASHVKLYTTSERKIATPQRTFMKAANDPFRYCWPVVARRFLLRLLTMARAVSGVRAVFR